MAIYYNLHGKTGHANPIEDGKFNTKKDSYLAMKKLIREHCNIKPELYAISREDLSSPKYRASVIKYLQILFTTNKHPSHEIIDYSDYKGKIRNFPPIRNPEEEEYATGYEKKMNFIEYYDNEDDNDVTPYDKELGFIFSVSKLGMHLQFLGTTKPGLNSRYTFQNCANGLAFNFEPGDGDNRIAIDLRSYKTDGTLPPKLTGSFYSVMLLNFLLNETEKRPISLREDETVEQRNDDPNSCLMWKMESELYAKMNDDFILPSKISLSDVTIERYIEALISFGYGVEDETKKWTEFNYKGAPVQIVEHKYYIPPFICKNDISIIVNCINNAHLDITESEKKNLIEKFKNEAGYHRYAKNGFEAAAFPKPENHGKLEVGHLALAIYHTLRLVDRPLQVLPKKEKGLHTLVNEYFYKDRKKAIDREAIANNTKSMIAIGLPIKNSKSGYYFDASKVLSRNELDNIMECIKESDLNENDKLRLIQKVNDNFPIGRY